ncbi:VOC family protein [Williamsia phyllosphaerae]|uniref:Glyoxalase n=1 Tax=Williamsia phyllosphaerae TaxID=885042 RepID=A0ABQ1V8Q2_9NOCA|nr:VOC family protein [Williamsia phyllosphaerae]GGF43204.1 glyoxalase [Williamsia phyllosphaerae]
MAIGFVNAVILDCPDTVALATFYQRVLGGQLDAADPSWVKLDCGLGGANLVFQPSPEHRPPTFPDPHASQQFHLDVQVTDFDAAERELLAAGATAVPGQAFEGFRVYLDPAGHPFCLVKK